MKQKRKNNCQSLLARWWWRGFLMLEELVVMLTCTQLQGRVVEKDISVLVGGCGRVGVWAYL